MGCLHGSKNLAASPPILPICCVFLVLVFCACTVIQLDKMPLCLIFNYLNWKIKKRGRLVVSRESTESTIINPWNSKISFPLTMGVVTLWSLASVKFKISCAFTLVTPHGRDGCHSNQRGQPLWTTTKWTLSKVKEWLNEEKGSWLSKCTSVHVGHCN